MEQRIKKIKLFRTLKVVYYCLGLPLFVLAVMTLASQIYGHWPFMSDGGDGLFEAIKVFFSSPAMYSVWIAFGIWLVIGIIQIICSKLIPNRHSRALVVIAVMLIVVLVPIFVIDAAYGAKVTSIREEYGFGDDAKDTTVDTNSDGLVIKDYSEQLSYYHTHSGDSSKANGKKTSLTDTLIANTTNFCTVYNIPYYGGLKSAESNNFANQALYYDDYNFDYNGDGTINGYDHILVSNTFDTDANKAALKDGRYWFSSITLKSKDGTATEKIDGNFYCIVYTQAIADGFGTSKTKNVKNYIWYDGDKGSFVATEGDFGTAYYNKNGMLSDGYIFSMDVALNILEAYYSGEAEMKAAFKAYTAAGGSLTEDALKAQIMDDAAIAQENRYTGADATDADKLAWQKSQAAVSGYTLTSAELGDILKVLGKEIGENSTVKSLVGTLLGGTTFSIADILGLVGLSDTLAEWATAKLGLDGVIISLSSGTGLTLNVSGGPFLSPVAIVIDRDFTLDSLNEVLTPLGIDNAMLADVLGLLGLTVQADGTITDMVASLLENLLYSYQSPVIDTVYSFYADATLNAEDASAKDKALYQYQVAYAKYSKAYYEGNVHGYMIGSRLIGDTIGSGNYSSDSGLTTLLEVQQMQVDLSYQPEMYSILIVRDMLMTFAALIIFFTLMSYIAADREILYATGKIELKGKRGKKKGKKDEASEEDAEPLAAENTDKEVTDNE